MVMAWISLFWSSENCLMAANLAEALGHSKALFVAKLIEDQIKEANLKLKIKIEAA